MIRYRIQPARPEARIFQVSLEISEPLADGQVLRMPAWIPGSYMIRDFARHVVRFEASENGQRLGWQKLDKDSWQLDPATGPVTVDLEVYASDLSVRGAHLDTTHGYFNGPCVFPEAVGHEHLACEVEVLAPQGADYNGWRLATGMPRVDGGDWEFGRFRAENYDALIDYPMEMGRFDVEGFEVCGVPHWVVISGRHRTDMARLVADLAPICEQHIRLFGEPPPMEQYLFLVRATGSDYGGLEHRNCSSLMCSRGDLPRRTDTPGEVRNGYRTFLGLCSHEYFHSWNIKRIKPEAFTPFDLGRESHTELLWAFEGITSYYDDLALVRAGRITPESYLELLGQTITRVYRGTGRHKQTVTESSFDAWTRFYKQDENAPNAIVSYYAKGSLVALALDLTLRELTGGDRSLDDVMRLLWERHGRTGVGVPEQGIQALAEEVAGQSLAEFFDHALYSTRDLPLEELLGNHGVQLNWRPPAGHNDRGGKPGPSSAPVHLGIRVGEDPLGARILVAHEQGAAVSAGLFAGDVIIALDGVRTDARSLDEHLTAWQPGEDVDVHFFRRDELYRCRVRLEAGEASTAWLTLTGQEAGAEPPAEPPAWLRGERG